jgi:hypothetical protein
MQVHLENTPYTSKDKFISNGKNKTALISQMSSALRSSGMLVTQSKDDADTDIIKSVLQFALVDSVEVRAEDGDILIMLVYHYNPLLHCQIFLTTSKGTFSIRDIECKLTPIQKRYLLFIHAFTGCDTVSAIYGFSKEKLFELFCDGSLFDEMDIFYDEHSSREAIQQAGIRIFQHMYKSPKLSLSTIRVNQFNKQSKAGVIRPEGLAPTDSAAAQHSLRAFLQVQDWKSLDSRSLNPEEYGWTIGRFGYEPILMTEPIAPENLLKFISCNCKGDCSTQRCSCKKNNVKCVTACGNCHGHQCKNTEPVENV